MINKLVLKPVHFYSFFFLAFVAFIFWLPDSGYDKYFWITWTNDIRENGLGNIYRNPEVNNQPLIMYLLQSLNILVGEPINAYNVNYLKVITILFDFGSLALFVRLLSRLRIHLWWIFTLLLNPAFWYNTIVWGQVDSIYTFFVLLSLLLSLNQKWLWAVIVFLVAINVKLPAIIFLPWFLILLFTNRDSQFKWWNLFSLLVGFQLIILLPFIFSGNLIATFQSLASSSLDWFPVVSKKAYNLWYFFFDDPNTTSDSVIFMGLTMKFWGLLLFSASLFMSLIIFFWKRIDRREMKDKLKFMSLAFTITAIAFFFFNTQMHERYIHSAILLSAVYASLSKRWELLILLSLSYLLNLEAVMQMLKHLGLDFFRYANSLVFEPRFIASIYVMAMILAFIELIRFKPLNTDF